MNPLLFACVINIFILLKLWSIPYKLTKEIEVDETYITHCRKGRKNRGSSRGRNEEHPLEKRGLSKEKICILTAVRRSGNCIARSFNVAKPRIDDVLQFSRCIEDKSYVWTDGLASYQKVLEEKEMRE